MGINGGDGSIGNSPVDAAVFHIVQILAVGILGIVLLDHGPDGVGIAGLHILAGDNIGDLIAHSSGNGVVGSAFYIFGSEGISIIITLGVVSTVGEIIGSNAGSLGVANVCLVQVDGVVGGLGFNGDIVGDYAEVGGVGNLDQGGAVVAGEGHHSVFDRGDNVIGVAVHGVTVGVHSDDLVGSGGGNIHGALHGSGVVLIGSKGQGAGQICGRAFRHGNGKILTVDGVSTALGDGIINLVSYFLIEVNCAGGTAGAAAAGLGTQRPAAGAVVDVTGGGGTAATARAVAATGRRGSSNIQIITAAVMGPVGGAGAQNNAVRRATAAAGRGGVVQVITAVHEGPAGAGSPNSIGIIQLDIAFIGSSVDGDFALIGDSHAGSGAAVVNQCVIIADDQVFFTVFGGIH